MMSTLSIVLKNPPIRVSALAIFFFGFSGAATSPYLSIIGIQELGLSDAGYSALIFIAAFVNVAASVLIGIFSDRLGGYRTPMLFVSLFGIVGYGLTFAVPTVFVFVAAMLLLIPVYNALNSLIFANVRASSKGMPVRDLIAVNSAVRATISLSWVLVPGLVGFFLATRASMLPAFLLASLAAGVCFVLFFFFLPKVAAPLEPRSNYAFLSSLGEIAAPAVLVRVLAIALISSMLHVNGAVLPLVVTGNAGGSVADVGIIVGVVALLEIVFILFWGWVERWISPVATLSIGASIYALYLFLLGFAQTPAHVYALTVISGLGAAAIISVPITYLQNLIAERAGLGSSLIAVNIFLSGGLSSLLFALGTGISDYSGTAVLGAMAGLIGIALLRVLDGPLGRGKAAWR